MTESIGAQKTCCRCGASLPIEAFFKDRSRRDGLKAQCKACKRELDRAWSDANREAKRERQRRYVANNRETRLASNRAWAARNPELVRAAHSRWLAANPDYFTTWGELNRERLREYGQRRRSRLRGATIGAIDPILLWEECGGCCGICAEPIDRTLRAPHPGTPSLDHIVPLAKGGTHEQSNLQWTHLVCNIRKGAKAP